MDLPPAPPHVAVLTFPFSSHTAVLFSVARSLAEAAPPAASFSFLSTAAALTPLREGASELPPNLRLVEIPDGLPPVGDAALPVPRRMELFMAVAEAGGVKEALEAATRAAGGARVSCVVGDAFLSMAAEAAAGAGVPWVPVWTAASSALVAHLSTDALRDDVGDQSESRADELLTSHAGLGSYRVRDLPDGVVSGDFNYVISLLLYRMAQRLPRNATAIALNTFPGLDPPDVTAALATALPGCLPIGPFHLIPTIHASTADTTPSDPHGCLSWLDRHQARAVAYVSFGTVAASGQAELHELAAGLKSAGSPFLWSLKEELWPLLPPGFLVRTSGDAGRVVPWAPQAAVLRHNAVGAFVTHAGWASVMEGLSAGQPMACRPFFGDQRMNARSVAGVWGVGRVFDRLMTRSSVAEAVVSLLREEEGRTMRAKAQELQAMVAKAFEHGGVCRTNFGKLVKLVCGVRE